MEKIISKLFSSYLAEQSFFGCEEYSRLAASALESEKKLRQSLSEEQSRLFEELFELWHMVHILVVASLYQLV